jgi:hypothetical protein
VAGLRLDDLDVGLDFLDVRRAGVDFLLREDLLPFEREEVLL